ncbi:hypothetical protein CIB84_003448 [Bambusicola thoracicus]|uniref:ZP domain-containing protein n=1 Tax=Bambusicola thoracicus TaxID=9083 RepID=A0A2P4T8W9_BAMTH|nr:hypothetical protein CIB84_003448 [Bambusicola thoracicus]
MRAHEKFAAEVGLQGKFFQLEINDPYTGPVLLDDKLASRCGYVLSEDVWGNPVFRASVLACHVVNEADELFSLTVNVKVSSFATMRAAVIYTYPMFCSYSSWASREIVCEENYMETQNVAYQVWQLMFVSPSGRKRILVSDAAKLGYSFNNTLSRVYLRAPYHSNESEISVVSGVDMNVITSTSMYRQRWLLLLIDMTVSCPLVNPDKNNYLLEHNKTHIGITIPIGAEGGKLKSSVSGGVYGIIYSIDLFLEHTWTDADWQTTKYTVIKSITTPFMPRIPTVINNTLPEEKIFNVAFGHFLPDVSLVAIAIGNVPFTLREAQHHGYKIYETPFSNGTKEFILEVSFDDPYVLKEVRYSRSLLGEGEIPEAVGYCDEGNLYLAIPGFGLHQYWNLYLGTKLLNRHTANTNGYLATTNATHLILQIPLFAVGVIYEEVSFQKIKARFDVALRKVRTMETLQTFSVSCNFNSPAFILCYPDGTVIISAQMKTVPGIDMSRTQLRDSSCKPKEYNKGHAFFKFHVTTCGTSVRFEGDHIVYENEISYEKETLQGQSHSTITRDPDYRRIRQALNVVSRVSKSESFMDFYESSVVILKRPTESVFLEVELKDESPDTELYLDNCWVTGSLDFNSTPRWNIIVDGQVVTE